ncbi:L-piperidine-6-carboxylate dehydrogenase [Luteibaculum oceani]|uniref:aldehyde dehydrogenase (NAD(+)) n=1 Tax=Luteibaculum oceani TaxID=1294296 RepID=A0A5C6VIH7_9FLAO|nr:aldehyde dehydrogenase family protein [Luteibaculum oceani]TXC85362.1 aldehyde dehydrogenase family protein [Luteibaculum oceani]
MDKILSTFKIKSSNPGTWIGKEALNSDQVITSYSPVDGKKIAEVSITTKDQFDTVIEQASIAQKQWSQMTAPQRGEIVRQYGNLLREYKDDLGYLVSYEMGKSFQEGKGEVQEMIDICDFAVGLSRQLYGLTMHSERPLHRMYEQWHPLGIVGIISAFNFPVAVWSWNTALAWVCGNVCIWKPSEKTPITALACQELFSRVLEANNLPQGISCVITGDKEVGQWLTSNNNVNLISATGSTAMGRAVGADVAKRFGKTILELGGNNALIVSSKANLKSAIMATVFGAVGTCGQRCTSTRRLLVHEGIYNEFISALKKAYAGLKIGSPLDESNHIGPLIDEQAVQQFNDTIAKIKETKHEVIVEGKSITIDGNSSHCYVHPGVYAVEKDNPLTKQEVFAPILYVIKYKTLDEAIHIQNDVPQGLSSALFTTDLQESEYFLSHKGSDCGIANINIGTSGAEIGGAFGGEKETGGGRESGSDAWKGYMRRQTNTINYSNELPLAQGIKFDI